MAGKLLRLIPALLVTALLAGVSSPVAQEPTGPTHHGTLSASYGENVFGTAIADADLRKLIDKCLPTYHSALFVFTQCYGGDMVDDFKSMPRTAILSATSPGQVAYYGGYDSGATKAMVPGAGRTSTDVHTGGNSTKLDAEGSNTTGDPVSLEPTSPNGPIKSRHVIFYAGQPDATAGRDVDQRKEMDTALGSLPNTTFTSVGGPPGEGTRGKDGWDFAGNFDGLKAALKEIKPLMSADEQFIFYVSDHGGREKVFNDFDWNNSGSVSVTLNMSTLMAETMMTETYSGELAGVYIDIDASVDLEEAQVDPNTLTVSVAGSELQAVTPQVDHVTFDPDGAPDPDDYFRLFYEISIAELYPYEVGEWPLDENDRIPLEFELINASNIPLPVSSVGVSSGAIAKPPAPDDGGGNGGGNGGDNPTAGAGPNPPGTSLTASPGDFNIPLLQSLFTPPAGGMVVNSVSLELGGNGDTNLIQGIDVWNDANGNGQVDSEDNLLSNSNGVPLLRDIPMLFPLFLSTEVEEQSELIILVSVSIVDERKGSGILAAGSTHPAVFAAVLCLLIIGVVVSRKRSRNPLAVASGALLVLVALALLACGGSGVGGQPGPDPQQHTYSITLADVDAVNVSNGNPSTFDGLPQTGSTVTAGF